MALQAGELLSGAVITAVGHTIPEERPQIGEPVSVRPGGVSSHFLPEEGRALFLGVIPWAEPRDIVQA